MRCFIKFFNNSKSMMCVDASWQSVMLKWLSSIFPCASVAIFARILPHTALPYGQTARNASVVLRPQPLALDLCRETLNISEFDKSRSCVQCNLRPMIGNQFSFSDHKIRSAWEHIHGDVSPCICWEVARAVILAAIRRRVARMVPILATCETETRRCLLGNGKHIAVALAFAKAFTTRLGFPALRCVPWSPRWRSVRGDPRRHRAGLRTGLVLKRSRSPSFLRTFVFPFLEKSNCNFDATNAYKRCNIAVGSDSLKHAFDNSSYFNTTRQ